jgi:hypothetical protein
VRGECKRCGCRLAADHDDPLCSPCDAAVARERAMLEAPQINDRMSAEEQVDVILSVTMHETLNEWCDRKYGKRPRWFARFMAGRPIRQTRTISSVNLKLRKEWGCHL